MSKQKRKYSTLPEATRCTPITGRDDAFSANIPWDWTIFAVPHGGYVAALLGSGAHAFFTTNSDFVKRNQPHTINYHIEFLARAHVAPATLVITPIKPGRAITIARVELFQTPPKTDKQVLVAMAIITQGNITAEAGLTELSPRRIEQIELPNRLADCVPCAWPYPRPEAAKKVIYWDPKHVDAKTGIGKHGWNVREQWLSFSDGNLFDELSLPLIADMFIPIPENVFLLKGGLSKNWYPTVNLSLEVKKVGQWKWLFVRSRVNVLSNGRNDVEILIMDEAGDIVGMSKHVCLTVGIARNTSGREKPSKLT